MRQMSERVCEEERGQTRTEEREGIETRSREECKVAQITVVPRTGR